MAHILIVEDNPVVRMVAQEHLKSAGYEVTTASDGQEALGLFDSMIPDLILSDIEMPRLDGIGLLTAIRSRLHISDIPIIFLTMHSDMETFRHTAALGADDYVNKPINRTVLLESINRLLKK